MCRKAISTRRWPFRPASRASTCGRAGPERAAGRGRRRPSEAIERWRRRAYATFMTVHLHEEDLPEGVLGPGALAVDTETMGLQLRRDRLCLVQIADGSGDEHLVRFA